MFLFKVCANGLVKFDQSSYEVNPRNFGTYSEQKENSACLAPYWSFVDLDYFESEESNVYIRKYTDRNVNYRDVFTKAEDYGNRILGIDDYKPQWVVIITWHNLQPKQPVNQDCIFVSEMNCQLDFIRFLVQHMRHCSRRKYNKNLLKEARPGQPGKTRRKGLLSDVCKCSKIFSVIYENNVHADFTFQYRSRANMNTLCIYCTLCLQLTLIFTIYLKIYENYAIKDIQLISDSQNVFCAVFEPSRIRAHGPLSRLKL